MNKYEAIKMMEQGRKMTHVYFSPDEWVTMDNGLMLFEDGCKTTPRLFWMDRTGERWETGWNVFNENKTN